MALKVTNYSNPYKKLSVKKGPVPVNVAQPIARPTVRVTQPQARPVRVVSPYTRPQAAIPSYGKGASGLWNKFKDVTLEANSPQDIARRQNEGQAAMYADQQLAKGVTPRDNLAEQMLGGIAKNVNTLYARGMEIPSTVKGTVAGMTNNQVALQNALREQEMLRNYLYSNPNSGVLNSGTIYASPQQSMDLGAGETAKRVFGGQLEAAGLLVGAPALKATLAASLAAKQVATQTGKSVMGAATRPLLGWTGKGALGGAMDNAGYELSTNPEAGWKDIAAQAAIGAVAAPAFGGAMYGAGRVANPLINKTIIPTASKAVRYMLDPAPLANKAVQWMDKIPNPKLNQQGYIQLPGGKPIDEIKLYHTTPSQFDKFDNKYLGTNTDYNNTRHGFYFTDNTVQLDDFKNVLKKGFGGTFTTDGKTKSVQDIAKYRTIEKIAKKGDFYNFNYNSKDFTTKDARLFAEFADKKMGGLYDLDGNQVDAKSLSDKELGKFLKDNVFVDDLDPDSSFKTVFNEEYMDDFVKFVKDKGYKGMITDYARGKNEYLVFDPNALQTKQELTDLHNKSKKFKPQKNQTGVLGQFPDTPTIKNAFGEEIPNPGYKPPKTGGVALSPQEYDTLLKKIVDGTATEADYARFNTTKKGLDPKRKSTLRMDKKDKGLSGNETARIYKKYQNQEAGLETVQDLAERLREVDQPLEIEEALNKYTRSVREDFEEFGMRGDAPQYEGELINAIEKHLSQPTPPKPVAPKGAPIEKKPNGNIGSVNEVANNTWWHGARKLNEGQSDTFYSASKEVAGDYSIMKVGDKPNIAKAKPDNLPKNPLVVDTKNDLVDVLGYKGDPLAEPIGVKVPFDELAKQYAKTQGHDGILYRYGSFEEPELHAFGKSTTVAPIEKTPASPDIDTAVDNMATSLKKKYPDGITLYHQTDSADIIAKEGFKSKSDLVYFTAEKLDKSRMTGSNNDGVVKVVIKPEDYHMLDGDPGELLDPIAWADEIAARGIDGRDVIIPPEIANKYLQSNPTPAAPIEKTANTKLPKGIAETEVNEMLQFGSTAKGIKGNDVDVAIFIDPNHPTLKKMGSEYNAKVGKTEYHVLPDNDEGRAIFQAMLEMNDQRYGTGKGVAKPIALADVDKVPTKEPAPKKAQEPAIVKPTEKMDDKAWESYGYDYLKRNDAKAREDYWTRTHKEFGNTRNNIIAGDEAKFVIDGFGVGRNKSLAYHEPASEFVKRLLKEALDDPTTKGDPVLVTAGGTGAGKTTSIKGLLSKQGGGLDDYAAVIDTNLTSMKSAASRVDAALESGRIAQVAYVYREPTEAFIKGVVPRARSTGRIVTTDIHGETHAGSLDTFLKLVDKYKGDRRVEFLVIDNSRGKDKYAFTDLDFLRQKRHSEEWVKEQVNEALKQEATSKRITPEEYRQYTGNDLGPSKNESNLGANAKNDAGKLEGERSSRNFTEQQVEVGKLKRQQEYQPRVTESGKGTEDSVFKKGYDESVVDQPIVVWKKGDEYIVLGGHSRTKGLERRAAEGLDNPAAIKARVYEGITEKQAKELALGANQGAQYETILDMAKSINTSKAEDLNIMVSKSNIQKGYNFDHYSYLWDVVKTNKLLQEKIFQNAITQDDALHIARHAYGKQLDADKTMGIILGLEKNGNLTKSNATNVIDLLTGKIKAGLMRDSQTGLFGDIDTAINAVDLLRDFNKTRAELVKRRNAISTAAGDMSKNSAAWAELKGREKQLTQKLNDITTEIVAKYRIEAAQKANLIRKQSEQKPGLKADKPTAPAIPQKGQSADQKIGTTSKVTGAQKQKSKLQSRGPSGQKLRGFIETVKNDQYTVPEIKDSVASMYNIRNSRNLVVKARNLVQSDPALAYKIATSGEISDVSYAVGMEYFKKLQGEGNFDAATDMIELIAKKGTKGGQASQILSMYSKLTPEGAMRFAQKLLDEYNTKYDKSVKLDPDAAKRIMDKAKEIQDMPDELKIADTIDNFVKEVQDSINPNTDRSRKAARLAREARELPPGQQKDQKLISLVKLLQKNESLLEGAQNADKINKLFDELKEMPDNYQREVRTQELLKEVRSVIPVSRARQISTVQTIAMLLNLKTFMRNVLGNAGFGFIDTVNQALVATPIDKLVGMITGERFVSLPNPVTMGKGIKKGVMQGSKEAWNNINTTGTRTSYDLEQIPIFKNKAMAALERANKVSLQSMDRAAYSAAFDDTVESLMRVRKTGLTDEILEQAHLMGTERTFQNDSLLSKAFVQFKRGLNLNKAFGAGDLVLKFPRTPANLMAQGLNYSPAGYANTLFQIGAPLFGKKFDQRAFVMSLSRATTGTTALFGTGYILGSLGIITPQPEQDKDLRNTQRAAGLGGYQINVSALKRYIASGFDADKAKLREGDFLASYDWAQPMAVPVSAGVAAGQNKPGDAARSTGANTASAMNTLIEQPLLTGVAEAFGSKTSGDIVQSATNIAAGAPSTFIPTAVNQVTQLTDNTVRNATATSFPENMKNQAIRKLPGLSRTLPESYNVTGQPIKRWQDSGPVARAFNVLINPSNTTNYRPNTAAGLALNLYNSTGEVSQMPRSIGRSVTVNGEKKQLTGREQSDYQKLVGTMTDKLFNQAAVDPAFKKLSDEDQVNTLSSMLTDINAAAKVQLFGGTLPKSASNRAKTLVTNKPVNIVGKTPSAGIGNTSAVKKTLTEWLPGKDLPNMTTAAQQTIADEIAKYNQKAADGTLGNIEAVDERKRILRQAYNTQLSEDERDLYKLSTDRLKAALAEGLITQANLDKALAVERQLFEAGLIQKETLAKKVGTPARGYKTSFKIRKGTSRRRSTSRRVGFKAPKRFTNPYAAKTKSLNSLLAKNTRIKFKKLV